MHQALEQKQPDGINVPSERTIYRDMEEIGISHRPKRKPNGIRGCIIHSDRGTQYTSGIVKKSVVI